MGYLFVFGFAALTLFALYRSGKCTRMALELSAAALLLGIAGYAWQGSPDMPGNPIASAKL
jgi:cytochrome c-type biogenesis protein CcmH